MAFLLPSTIVRWSLFSSPVDFRSAFVPGNVAAGQFSPRVWSWFLQGIVWLRDLIWSHWRPLVVLNVILLWIFNHSTSFRVHLFHVPTSLSPWRRARICFPLLCIRFLEVCPGLKKVSFSVLLYLPFILLPYCPAKLVFDSTTFGWYFLRILSGCQMSRRTLVWICSLRSGFPQIFQSCIVYLFRLSIPVDCFQDLFTMSILVHFLLVFLRWKIG